MKTAPAASAFAAVALGGSARSATPDDRAAPFGFCLNTSTIMGQKLSAPEQFEIAAKAGYGAVEPWIRDLDAFAKNGGKLADLGKRIKDLGLVIPSTIGFAEWIVDDDARRARGLEQMKRDMETVQKIGGLRIAAPPVGMTDRTDLDLRKAAERYRAILEIGDGLGVIPEVEIWGFSKSLNRIADAAFIAIEAHHAKACILPDVYHLYRGGSDFTGLRVVSGSAIPVFHMNDYPATPGRETITDADRVFPGDGVAPLAELFRDLKAIGFTGYLSLELFNKKLWEEEAMTVARQGIEKMKEAVARAFA